MCTRDAVICAAGQTSSGGDWILQRTSANAPSRFSCSDSAIRWLSRWPLTIVTRGDSLLMLRRAHRHKPKGQRPPMTTEFLRPC
jgi:hypothetical protein